MTDASLLTEDDRAKLLVNALSDGTDHFPVVKLFAPDGEATWLFTEVDPDDPDRFFGLCDLGLGFPELGYASLAEISGVRGRFGLQIERDMYFVGAKPLSVYAEEARRTGMIVT